MTELPALRNALRDTAERHTHRASRSAIRLALALGAAAVLVLAIASLTGSDSLRVPADEVPAPSASPIPGGAATLEQAQRELATVFAVFRRPVRATDRVPAALREPVARAREQVAWDQARRVAFSGRLAMYAAPAVYDGKVGLCTLQRVSARVGGSGCGTFVAGDAATKLRWMKTFVRSGGPVYSLMVPDGVTRIELHLSDGRTIPTPVRDNGVMYQGHGVRGFSWTDRSGAEHSMNASI
jgi:hypothetical protein